MGDRTPPAFHTSPGQRLTGPGKSDLLPDLACCSISSTDGCEAGFAMNQTLNLPDIGQVRLLHVNHVAPAAVHPGVEPADGLARHKPTDPQSFSFSPDARKVAARRR